MGEPFRGGVASVAPIARWFGRADRNQDGVLSADEMQVDADSFFSRLDSNHDGQIDPDELRTYEWEIAPEIQVNSEWRRPRGQSGQAGSDRKRRDEHDGYKVDGLQGAARYGLLNIPQPVASADADFNRVITLVEFRQATSQRFRLLDVNGLGRITLPDLEARLPVRPKGRRAKRHKDETDSRIGLPLPEGD
jgi:Ca2+-binding EF-hand superfamily protein